MMQTHDIPLGRYRHYKGKDYQVLGAATHSETGERLVVYRCLYGDYDLWVRPVSMFSEVVEVDGQQVPRFTLIAPSDATDKGGDNV